MNHSPHCIHICAELCENARLSLAKDVIYASSVAARPGSVDAAYRLSDRCRDFGGRSPHALLGFLNCPSAQSESVLGDSPFISRSLCQLLHFLSQLRDRVDWSPCKDYAIVDCFQIPHMSQKICH
jgi:hypothetical protein